MSSFLDRGQLVGYQFSPQMLTITLSDKMGEKMKADGWDVEHDADLGYFINIKKEG